MAVDLDIKPPIKQIINRILLIHSLNFYHFRTNFEGKTGPHIRVCHWKLFFLFLNQNICFWYWKEPSRWDGSFEHPKHMFKLMDKKIITILRKSFLLNWPYGKQQSLFELLTWFADLILYVPVNIFSVMMECSKMQCGATSQAIAATHWSRVKHSTTALLFSW